MMTRRYHYFTLRIWDGVEARQGIDVRHVQTGELVRVASIGAAVSWIGEQARTQAKASGVTAADPSGKAAGNLI